MLHHSRLLTNLAVKVTDFEILHWSFWLKVFRIRYLLNPWMDLVDTIPDVRNWSKILRCSIPTPHLLTDFEVKVTDLEFFMINEMSKSHISQSSESIHLSNIRTLEGIHVHVIFSWAQIGRSAIFGREIGVPDREIVSRQKMFKFNVKNCLFASL